jgi:hypothetical protein
LGLSESSWRPAFFVVADEGTAFGDEVFGGRATAMLLAATKIASENKKHWPAETSRLIRSSLMLNLIFPRRVRQTGCSGERTRHAYRRARPRDRELWLCVLSRKEPD